jgi:hypothetical protein
MSSLAQIAAYRPQDIDEAADGMRDALELFHRENDHRAIFARAYYLITLMVRQAVHQRGWYPQRFFYDANWVKRLAGRFSSLYFVSLTTDQRPAEQAWKFAHSLAVTREGTVFQNLLLGLNAHINYDLAYGIYQNLKELDDVHDNLVLNKRKFDHDHVNNILVDSLPLIESTITRDYGGEVQLLGKLSGGLDDALGGAGLKYYRERVWWNAIAFLSARSDEEIQFVRGRLDWESTQLANSMSLDGSAWKRSLRESMSFFGKSDFSSADLEPTDYVPNRSQQAPPLLF